MRDINRLLIRLRALAAVGFAAWRYDMEHIMIMCWIWHTRVWHRCHVSVDVANTICRRSLTRRRRGTVASHNTRKQQGPSPRHAIPLGQTRHIRRRTHARAHVQQGPHLSSGACLEMQCHRHFYTRTRVYRVICAHMGIERPKVFSDENIPFKECWRVICWRVRARIYLRSAASFRIRFWRNRVCTLIMSW